MPELHLPFLEMAIAIPLIGAAIVARMSESIAARKWSLIFTGMALLCTIGAWQDFEVVRASQRIRDEVVEAGDSGHLMRRLTGREVFVIDELSAPLLPLTALLYFLTTLATLRTKVRRFSFGWALVSESLRLALFSAKIPWLVIGLLAAGIVPIYLELRGRGGSTRVFVYHMALFVGLLVLGEAMVDREGHAELHVWSALILLAAVLVRCGVVPFHCWMTDLFERATFGTAMLFVAPVTGAYAMVRLVLPIATDSMLRGIGVISLVTAIYASGLALVQREARRFFCFLLISHSSLVLVGMEIVTPVGLTGALCMWMSVGLALSGFGLTIRALEARRGRLSLVEFQGLYEHTPALAICFLLTGLASVGFPGTFGFIGGELLVDGAVETYPSTGVAVFVIAALNGIAVVQAYFKLFTGTRHLSSVSLGIGRREQVAVLTLSALIVFGGLIPQPHVQSRYYAAQELLGLRHRRHLDDTHGDESGSGGMHSKEPDGDAAPKH